MTYNSSSPSERGFTCSDCGSFVPDDNAVVDESGMKVVKCPECGRHSRKRRVLVRTLPDTLARQPEAEFNKRPV